MSFLRLVLAIALGVLLAGAVSAAVSLVFFGAMVASFFDASPAYAPVSPPVSVAGFGAAQVEIERYRADQERVLNERAARIEQSRPPRYPVPPAHATPGELYCLHGFVARREVNGWADVKSPSGQRIACRTS